MNLNHAISGPAVIVRRDRGGITEKVPMKGRSSVSSKAILQALTTLRRRGRHRVLRRLEVKEPELASFVMEELSLVHRGLLQTGASAKRVQRLHHQIETLLLVCISASIHNP